MPQLAGAGAHVLSWFRLVSGGTRSSSTRTGTGTGTRAQTISSISLQSCQRRDILLILNILSSIRFRSTTVVIRNS
jgi:hypothetical protein